VGVSFLLRFISEVAVLVIRHRLQLLPCHLNPATLCSAQEMKTPTKIILLVLFAALALFLVNLMKTEYVNDPQVTVLKSDAGAPEEAVAVAEAAAAAAEAAAEEEDVSKTANLEQVGVIESAGRIKKVEATILERQSDQRVTIEIKPDLTLVFNSPKGVRLEQIEGDRYALHGLVQIPNLANGICRYYVRRLEDSRLTDKEKLRQYHSLKCQELVSASKEQTINVFEVDAESGFGFRTTFTDKKLVGEPIEVQNSKTVTVVTMVFSDYYLVEGRIFVDDVRSEESRNLLRLITSMTMEHSSTN
jgi:hypothetical protein